MKKLLKSLNACPPAIEWAGNKKWPEIYATCDRGDWLLWLYARTNGDKKTLVLAGAKCAETVKHLMTTRAIATLNACFKYVNGEITDQELKKAAEAAWAAGAATDTAARAAARAADAEAAMAASAAAWATDDAVRTAAWAATKEKRAAAKEVWEVAEAANWEAAISSRNAGWEAGAENQKQAADIVRELIPIEQFKIQ